MNFTNKIEFRNILLDVFITLLAFQFIDISDFVKNTLSFAIHFIIIIQSFALFLLLSDSSFDEKLETSAGLGFTKNIKMQIKMWLRGFAMFSWVIGPLWIMIPIGYLKEITGQSFGWAYRISMFVGIVSGIILLVRFFANSPENNEEEYIEGWFERRFKDKTWVEILIIPVYNFFFYQNIGTSKFRYWLSYFITFGYLIYTETLFEIMVTNSSLEKPLIVLGILGSYFPIRMLLLLKSPFSLFEVVSAFTAFGIFVYMLFA